MPAANDTTVQSRNRQNGTRLEAIYHNPVQGPATVRLQQTLRQPTTAVNKPPPHPAGRGEGGEGVLRGGIVDPAPKG